MKIFTFPSTFKVQFVRTPDINIYSHITVCTLSIQTKGLQQSILFQFFFYFGFRRKYVRKCYKKLDLLASFEITVILSRNLLFRGLTHTHAFIFFLCSRKDLRINSESFRLYSLSCQVKPENNNKGELRYQIAYLGEMFGYHIVTKISSTDFDKPQSTNRKNFSY